MKKMICIVCPRGCSLQIDEQNNYQVTGNLCKRGEVYGKSELINPTRVITSTVKIRGASLTRLPVKTDNPIEKGMIKEVMKLLDDILVVSPIKIGDIIISNILGTKINIVATKNM